MISDEKAGEILDIYFNRSECINRIKEITQERVYYYGRLRGVHSLHHFLPELLHETWLSYIYGLFAESIIVAGECLEEALREELVKKNYPEICLKALTLEKLIDSAKDEGVIKKETAKTAHKLRRLRNKYVHPNIKETIARAVIPIEGNIQLIGRREKEKRDAKDAIEKAYTILLEVYSEQRYPLDYNV